DFDEVLLPLDTDEFQRRIGEYSAARQVPVLCGQNWSVSDSLAICETVNQDFCAGRMWPEDAHRRASARSLCAEIHSGFLALRAAMPMNIRARDRRVEISPEVAANIARAETIWQQAEVDSWLFGEFSIADAMFAPVVMRFPTYGVELSGRAADYSAWVQADEDIRRWVAAALCEDEIVDADEVGA
ncbi:MAG: glutathione S-transferase, partial [Halieaceae bacterium]